MALAILCSGQGGQHAGLFDLVVAEPDGRAALDAIGRATGFDPRVAAAGPALFDNAVAQPLICTVALATWSLIAPRLADRRIAPLVFAGYSVGELAAHGCAGALSLDTTIALARQRAVAMDAASAAGDGLVALRGLRRAAIDALCATHGAHVAIVNGDEQWIVGGPGAALDAVLRDAVARGAVAQRLPVAVAAHTPLLASAVAVLRDALAAATWSAPTTPVIASLDGSFVRDPRTAIDLLARQVGATIRWDAVMDSVHERGARVCLELGPGSALARLMRERHPTVACRSATDFRRIDALVDWVGDALG